MIGLPRFPHERLGQQHDRASFRCTREPALEKYLTESGRAARENAKSISAVFVLLDSENERRIAGYFTLSNTALIPSTVPVSIAKKLPRYDSWGALKLGRMARHDDYAEMGIGPILIARAFQTALTIEKQTGSFALVVDAKNSALASWYASLGFISLIDSPLRLFIPNHLMAGYLRRLEIQ